MALHICLLFSSEVSSYLPKKLQQKSSMRKAAVQVHSVNPYVVSMCV